MTRSLWFVLSPWVRSEGPKQCELIDMLQLITLTWFPRPVERLADMVSAAEGQPARLARHTRRVQLVEQVRLRKCATHAIMQRPHPGHVMASPISRARPR